jgi:aldehyde dehydrogenase (NAD+)
LGRLVSIETGKILEEGLGEVQEAIDIADFALGLSRQLYGLTIASERPGHRMMETWHPLGAVGVITAFNFPVAVWAWNFALAVVCGDSVVWKPSEKASVSALACRALWERAVKRFGAAPEGLLAVVLGGRDVGERMVDDPRLRLISATGGTAMGRAVAPRVAARLGRTLLELGGNNALIVLPGADLAKAASAAAFGSFMHQGQICMAAGRHIVHEDIYDDYVAALAEKAGHLPVGDPKSGTVALGPVIDERQLHRGHWLVH